VVSLVTTVWFADSCTKKQEERRGGKGNVK